jgi:tetratricopeptide (TPR) repeat protein
MSDHKTIDTIVDAISKTMVAGTVLFYLGILPAADTPRTYEPVPITADARDSKYRSLLSLADQLHAKGRYYDIVNLLGKHEYDKNNTNPVFFNNLGLAYQLTDRYDDAIRCLQKSVKLQPKNATTNFNLGFAYYKVGEFDSAKYYIDESYRINKNPLAGSFKKMLDKTVKSWAI